MPLGIGPIVMVPSRSTSCGKRSCARWLDRRAISGWKPAGIRIQLCASVRQIVPGTLRPNTKSNSRLSGHSICSIEALKTRIRASTDGSCSNGPTVLLRRNGAVDQRLISDGGLV